MTQHNLILADFDPAEMAKLPPAEARRYFILRYFVPVAHDMLASLQTDFVDPDGVPQTGIAHRCVGLFIRQDNGQKFWPILVGLEMGVHGPLFRNQGIEDDAYGTVNQLSNECINRHHTQVLNGVDQKALSGALAHAFGKSFWTNDTYELRQAPLFAVLEQNPGVKPEFKLSVVCKTKDRVPREDLLKNQAFTRSQLIGFSPTYDQRPYNLLTGEWVGLCEPSDPACCEVCRKIYNSPCAENAYGGGGTP